jgi:hypothetical protein
LFVRVAISGFVLGLVVLADGTVHFHHELGEINGRYIQIRVGDDVCDGVPSTSSANFYKILHVVGNVFSTCARPAALGGRLALIGHVMSSLK